VKQPYEMPMFTRIDGLTETTAEWSVGSARIVYGLDALPDPSKNISEGKCNLSRINAARSPSVFIVSRCCVPKIVRLLRFLSLFTFVGS
jgi:hypothetical protein